MANQWIINVLKYASVIQELLFVKEARYIIKE